ncbi:MAG TPA: hypothetical protein VK249_08850 [Anaerolineales bacterium]|nr:hypothetical protein [Anaerolineales bacterium]
MKTRTYLRFSLLIPFLIWGICFLLFILWSRLASDGPGSIGSGLIPGLILWLFLFYVFGILGWFLPYGLLAFILLILSFRSRAEVLMKVFALAPVAMAILIIAIVNLLSIGSQDWNIFSSNPAANTEDFFGTNLWFAILTLIWGYLCVGLGFGIYKILQRRGLIKDEVMPTPLPLPEPF